jgi:hypothetical protein
VSAAPAVAAVNEFQATVSPVLPVPFALSRIAAGGAELTAGAGLTPSGENVPAWLDRMAYVPREVWDPAASDPEPSPLVAPEVPVETAPEEPAAEAEQEEAAADGTQDGEATEGETTDPESSPPADEGEEEPPPPDDQSAESEPDAITATPLPGP